MLKKLMIGAGLATLLAASAMAQSYQPEVGSGNIVPGYSYSPQYNAMQGYGDTRRWGNDSFAFERSAPRHHMRHHDRNEWNLEHD